MIGCKKCGVDNPLGRVFCGSCGSKLDLTHMTSDAVSEAQRVSAVQQHWPKVVIAVVLALVGLVVMACWPYRVPIGVTGTLHGGKRVENMFKAIKYLAKGRSFDRELPENDINGYFQFIKNKELKVDSVSMSVQDGFLNVRVIRTFGRLGVWKYEVPITSSCDLLCIPVGGRLHVKKGRIGHLPAVGPIKTSVAGSILKLVAEDKDWQALKYASKIKATESAIQIQIKK